LGNFANLHIHSESSFLDGLSRVDEIAKRAAELGQPAVALTDHGEVNGHLAFQKACKDHGVHPIFGMEGYFTLDLNKSREDKTRGYDNSHITLLAKDQKGLENLWAWSSRAYEPENFYYKPQADLKLMREYSHGLYASDGCMLTEFARNVAKGDEPAAREIIGKLLSVFGDNFYMELHPWQFLTPESDEEISLTGEMRKLNLAKIRIANELGIRLVVVNDAHYARPEQWENHALVWDFNTGKNSDQRGRGQTAAWMMSEEELVFWMSKHGVGRSITEEAIKNSLEIAQSCNVEISPTLEMPRLSRSEQEDFVNLEKAVWQSYADRIPDNDAYRERLDKELKVICDKGFAGYFNIVTDYVKAAKTGVWRSYVSTGAQREKLLVGPGRGSAGGSLVAYLLGITSIDPIRHGLIFERFINPGRKDFPDIDVDVPQSRRSQLKEYLGARFGHDHVCHIGTRARSAPRGMLADLCRVMGISFSDRMAMSAIIEEVEDFASEDDSLGWDEIIAERGGDLAPWAKRYPKLFEKMGEMVGLARQSGTHASGILIANQPLLGTLPTRVKNELVVSQFDMHEVEWLGAVKLDLLGLRHLDTLMVARDLIHEASGTWLDYESFGDTEFNDSDIWGEMERGQTVGIFQLETASGTRVTRDFKPRSMTDVADLISVNRPGVIRAGLLGHYINRRHGIEAVSFDHPLMETIVGDTYGVLVYQEQLIQACQTLAGFSLEEADELRKLIGKKLVDKLGPMREKFAAGCLANEKFMDYFGGRQDPKETITKIWASFEAAGSYCFNKSHAIGYATIASWEIWTKHYYPKEFIVALMQTDSENINKYVREARKRGIEIMPPDINLSDKKFTLCDNAIRYGLDTVYGVGPTAVDDIIANRPFESLDDFLARTTGRGAGKKSVVLNLIKIGAFDTLGKRRPLMESFCASRKDLADTAIPDFDDEKVVYEIEKELVGNFVTVDPMGKYLNAVEAICIQHPDEIKNYKLNDMFYVGGMVTRIKRHKTKRGKDMAFFATSWNEEEFDIVAFPDSWESVKNLLKVGVPVACQVIKLEKGCCLSTLERLDLVIK
jgi:DNA polymerase-3 subunit alpha